MGWRHKRALAAPGAKGFAAGGALAGASGLAAVAGARAGVAAPL